MLPGALELDADAAADAAPLVRTLAEAYGALEHTPADAAPRIVDGSET